MLAGHRWEYDQALRWYKCVGLPFGGVESHQWCIGCGAIVTDKELHSRRIPKDDKCFLHSMLDSIVGEYGYPSIEAGTFAEEKFRARKSYFRDMFFKRSY